MVKKLILPLLGSRRPTWSLVDSVLSCRGEVMSDVVGILFGKPDGIICGYLDAHNAVVPMRRDHLLKCLCAWVEHGQVITPHFTEPDTPLVVDSRSHHAAIRL